MAKEMNKSNKNNRKKIKEKHSQKNYTYSNKNERFIKIE